MRWRERYIEQADRGQVSGTTTVARLNATAGRNQRSIGRALRHVGRVQAELACSRLAEVALLASVADALETIGYGSQGCDADFRTLTARGAVVIEPPEDRTWGVRVAYLQGQGRLTIELEQPLRIA